MYWERNKNYQIHQGNKYAFFNIEHDLIKVPELMKLLQLNLVQHQNPGFLLGNMIITTYMEKKPIKNC